MDNHNASGSNALPSIGSQLPSLSASVNQPNPVPPTAIAAASVPIEKTQQAAAQSVNATPNDVSSTTHMTVPATAEDTDLIEKEWIHKIEQIVEHTKDDPYEQSKELTVLKAEYLRRRYNKTIKIEE